MARHSMVVCPANGACDHRPRHPAARSFIFICYVVAYIDRVNIGFAAADLQKDLGLSDWAYGLGAGLFFLGYFLFEVPSNLVLDRVGARIGSRESWSCGSGHDGDGLRPVRRASTPAHGGPGLAEAGFFPGVMLYLTYWIPARIAREPTRSS